jgi:F-type H+-transporting ATPase subunit b
LKGSKIPLVLILAALPFLLFMSVEEEHHDSNSMAFIAKMVNFFVLFGGLAYLLRKPVKQFLEARAVQIDTTIRDAEDSRHGAELDLEKTEKRVVELSHEIEELKDKALSEGEREKERIIRAAKDEGERMKEAAQQEIELISRAGIRGLKEFAMNIAAAEALERIEKQLSPEDHSRLIDDSIERLEALYEESRSD